MKKISIVLLSAATLLAAGCQKNMSEELNQDPKSASSTLGTAEFTDGEFSLTNTITTTSVSVSPFRVISQEWNENSYEYESDYNLSYYNSPGGFWNNLYVNTIHNLDLAKANYGSQYWATPGDLRNSLIITDVLEIYSYYMLVSTYGNIPYSQAESDTIPFPVFDDSKTVYEALLTRIDTCIAGLDITQQAMGSADQIYNGNVTEWLKFAASLKLKMAMLNATNDPTTTMTKVNEAIGTGLFTSNADNALFAYDAASPTTSNPIWNAIEYSGRHDFGPGGLLVSTMLGLNDPRLPDYFTLYDSVYTTPTGTASAEVYLGGQAGNPNNTHGQYSDFCCQANSSLLYNASLPGDILDYAEVEFYLAEAQAQGLISGSPNPLAAAANYDSAITASIEFWGGTAAQASTYLAQPSVAYSTAGSTWQQVIGYQEFIANYNKNWDSWTDERRLGQPNINVVSPPQGASTNFPLRLTYPPNETTSNSTNTAAAVAALPGGIDALTATLFWE
jgi:Starch-binding associating with outer membrane